MNEIQKIANEAKLALAKLRDGKTYTTKYVLDRLQKAADNNSRDALIGHMRDLVEKRASNQQFITQREIGTLYNELYGLSGGRSSFRQELEDLLPSKSAQTASVTDASSSRIPYEKELSPMYGESGLSKELEGVFSLDAGSSFSSISDSAVKKAEKFAKLQLISLGTTPTEVKAVKTNSHFILCNATISTPDFSQVSVAIPVQISNGIPALPETFVQDGEIVKLNKENLYVFLKDSNNHRKASAKNSFAGQRAFDGVAVESVATPSALADYANLDNELVAAATEFSRDQVRVATSIVASEFASLGASNAQVNVAGSNAGSLLFNANVPHTSGNLKVSVAVDMPNGMPVIPTKMSVNGKSYPLNETGIRQVLASEFKADSIDLVSRSASEMGKMSYAQLVEQVDAGVAHNDFLQAENALIAIQDRFEPEQYKLALDRFSRLLKHATGSSERDELIKAAFDRGDLIKVPTSTQLYCPKLGLPVSKIAFDSKGRVIPRNRVGVESMGDSGALISSSKITLT